MIDVLIVEDDPMVREMNKRYLSQVEGFQLKGIASYLKPSGENISLKSLKNKRMRLQSAWILLDIYMPGRNGVELLTEIRRQNQAVDVIVISAASEMDVVQKTLPDGHGLGRIIRPLARRSARRSRRFYIYVFHYVICDLQRGFPRVCRSARTAPEAEARCFRRVHEKAGSADDSVGCF